MWWGRNDRGDSSATPDCPSVFPSLNSTITSAATSFVYGTPFSLTLSLSTSVDMEARRDHSAASLTPSLTYRWLGLTGLPPGATVTSASGVNWLQAVP